MQSSESGLEIEEVIIIDVEECVKNGELPPQGMRYRIRVDKNYYVVDVPEVTGRDILLLAGKTPPERYRLDEKLKGGATKKIELTDIVDLTTHGVERFMTIPLDQTEGAGGIDGIK